MKRLIRPIIIVIGTRPEGIKLAPVYFALKQQGYPVKICATFQHTSLLQEVFDLFKINPDFSFDIMQVNQDLFHVTQAVLGACKDLFVAQNPQLIIVQGDTTTAMASSLAAFYLKIPVAHVEAGLRTGDIYAPFPEEFNRQFISLIAKYHFAPTAIAVANLKTSGVNPVSIYQVGNTVVDALGLVTNLIESGELKTSFELKKILEKKQKDFVLLTMHRRESFGTQMLNTLSAIKEFAQQNLAVNFIYPVHPNPQVGQAVELAGLKECANIYLMPALPYHELVYVLNRVNCVVTDSGGIQEEAASLGKPVVLLRNETDRPEAILAGLTWLAGYDRDKIHAYLNIVIGKTCSGSAHGEPVESIAGPCSNFGSGGLEHPEIYNSATGIYGDGNSAQKIVEILKKDI